SLSAEDEQWIKQLWIPRERFFINPTTRQRLKAFLYRTLMNVPPMRRVVALGLFQQLGIWQRLINFDCQKILTAAGRESMQEKLNNNPLLIHYVF
ncbi:MAG: hypothetical protein WCG27_13035, partial [Pseudomonadota bacterium]